MKTRTIAVLAAAGCAIYLVAQQMKSKATESTQNGTPQDTGNTNNSEPIKPEFVATPKIFNVGDRVSYKGQSYTVFGVSHPVYTLLSDLKGKTIAFAEDLTPLRL